MKNIFKVLTLGAVAIGFTACTDLETDIDARYTDLPDNPIAFEGELNSCYRYMYGWFGRDFNEGITGQGDELMGKCYGTGSYWDDGRYGKPCFHDLNLDLWSTRFMMPCMEGSTQCNKVILNYGGESGDSPIIAPVRLMRAYYHFWMMEEYGDVPIMNRLFEEGEQVDRQPRAKVAEFIESELLELLAQENAEGEPALSKNNDASTYGKPNYWMGAALLVKLYLNWGVYTNDITTVTNDTPNEKLADCVKWCDEIIVNGPFEVGHGYRVKFFPNNGVHIKDFIYAHDVDPATKADGCTTWYRWFAFRGDSQCKPGPLSWDNPQTVSGNYCLTPEALARFCLPGDERNDIVQVGPQFQMDANFNITDIPVILYKDPAKENTRVGQLEYVADFDFEDAELYSIGNPDAPAVSKTTIADGTALLNGRKGARLCKFPCREEDYMLWDRNQANDVPIFRYADILLTKAECIMRGASATLGHTVEGLVNEVRACSNAPAVTGNFGFQELMDERSREFILEPWRRNDLIRCGMFENDWGQKNRYKVWDDADMTKFHWVDREGVKDPNRRLMPLHRDILNANTNWSQNPGYAGL